MEVAQEDLYTCEHCGRVLSNVEAVVEVEPKKKTRKKAVAKK